MTALMKAVNNNDVPAVKELIAAGSDVNAPERNGDVPLIMAAYKGYADIVKLLLEAGADVKAVDPSMKATALHAAAYAGRTEAARQLIAHGIEIDKQGPYNGYTALHDTIWQNHVETAALLLEAGAKLSLKSKEGQTPLEFAKARGHREIVTLLEKKVSANT